MFIKNLKIINGVTIIRNVAFKAGLNLIVDDGSGTGNDVGKTTLLRLIDMCLGGDEHYIYTDSKTNNQVDENVETFLKTNKIILQLQLTENFQNAKADIVIERNFAWASQDEKFIINNVEFSEREFKEKLKELIFKNYLRNLPSFRTLISHNVRFDADKNENPLIILNDFATAQDYSSMYLALLGIEMSGYNQIAKIKKDIRKQNAFITQLHKEVKVKDFNSQIKFLDNEIIRLQEQKDRILSSVILNRDLDKLKSAKRRIAFARQNLNEIEAKISSVKNAAKELLNQRFDVDLSEIEMLYKEAKSFVPQLHIQFSDLVLFHNKMIENKTDFFKSNLDELNSLKESKAKELNSFIAAYNEIDARMASVGNFSQANNLENAIRDKITQRASLITQLKQLENAKQQKIHLENVRRDLINSVKQQAPDVQSLLEQRISIFNKTFSEYTSLVCGTPLSLGYRVDESSKAGDIYDFSLSDSPRSTGQRISLACCFELALIAYSDFANIPICHFLLNDRKELVDDVKLSQIFQLVKSSNAQMILAILHDKLPADYSTDEHVVLRLSAKEKLLKI